MSTLAGDDPDRSPDGVFESFQRELPVDARTIDIELWGGVDAIPDALKAVADGKLTGTVFQDAHGQGTLAVELAVQLVHGETVKHDNYTLFQLVTKENLANFVK